MGDAGRACGECVEGSDIDRVSEVIAEAVEEKASLIEIIPGKGSGQLKKRVLRFLDQKERSKPFTIASRRTPTNLGGCSLTSDGSNGVVGDCAPSASGVYVFPGVPAHQSYAQSCDSGEGERQPTLRHNSSDRYQSGGEGYAPEVAYVHFGSLGRADTERTQEIVIDTTFVAVFSMA